MSDIRGGSGTVGGFYVGQTYIAGSPKLGQLFIETFIDTIGLSDNIKKKTIIDFVDSISFSDFIHRLNTKEFVDNISLLDNSTVIRVFLKHFVDTMVMIDNFSLDLRKFFSRFFVDVIGVQDNYSRTWQKFKHFVDVITAQEAVSKKPIKHYSEMIGMQDNISKKTIKTFMESINLTEVYSKSKQYTRAFLDTIGITEVYSKSKQYTRAFLELIGIMDTVSKQTSKHLVDTISMREKIIKKLNGVLLIWSFVKNKISTVFVKTRNKQPITLTRITNKIATITPEANKILPTYTKIKNKSNADLWEKVPNRDE